MVDFPKRKWDFRGRSWSGAFWEPQERKKEKTKCSYSRAEKKAAQSSVFFNKKETLLLKLALSQGKVVPEEANRAIAAFLKNLQDFAKF